VGRTITIWPSLLHYLKWPSIFCSSEYLPFCHGLDQAWPVLVFASLGESLWGSSNDLQCSVDAQIDGLPALPWWVNLDRQLGLMTETSHQLFLICNPSLVFNYGYTPFEQFNLSRINWNLHEWNSRARWHKNPFRTSFAPF